MGMQKCACISGNVNINFQLQYTLLHSDQYIEKY